MTRGTKLLIAFSILGGLWAALFRVRQEPLDGLAPLSEEWLASHCRTSGQQGDPL